MGNKQKRTHRKKNYDHRINFIKNKTNTVTSQNYKVSTNEIEAATVVVDVPSILNSVFDVEHNTQPTGTNEHGIQDPLLVIKTEDNPANILDEQPDELPSIYNCQSSSVQSIGSVKLAPISNEAVVVEPSTEFKNMCRLCLTKDGARWIEIFSNEAYAGCAEITPSNIAAIIEQSTTVKISTNDHLPNQLCQQCFQSLRFVQQFREKSIRSQSSLNSMVNNSSQLSQKNEQEELIVTNTNLQPLKRVVKVVHLKRVPKPIQNAKRNATPHLPAKGKMNGEVAEKSTGAVQCELCGNIFVKRENLQYHMNRHNDVRPFVCTELFCDKAFYSPMNLKCHIRNVHCPDRPYKCDVCDKAYSTSDKLKIHRTNHFPPTIPCNICGKLLRSRASVSKHRICHATRKFECDDCGKSFNNVYTLNVHRRIHTNEKPFICCKCGEAFAYNCLLKAHTVRKH